MVSGRLTEKDGYIYIVLSYKGIDGKRKQPWFNTGLKPKGNKKIAEQKLKEYQENFDIISGKLKNQIGDIPGKEKEIISSEVRIINNSKNPKADILFSDYLIEWVESHKKYVCENTYASYYDCIHSTLVPYFQAKQLKLSELTPQHFRDFYDYKLQKVKANTIKRYHSYLNLALKQAFIDELIPINPLSKVRLPKIDQFIGSYYNDEELHDLFDLVKDTNIEFPILIAAYYGLRRSEIVGLKWSAFDFTYKTITIKHTVVRAKLNGKKQLIKKEKTKNAKSYRTLPLFPYIEEVLIKMRREQERNKFIIGEDYNLNDSEYIYVDSLGDLRLPEYITDTFKVFLARHQRRHIRFHDLRHSCATLLRHLGVPLEDIQKWLGHSDITTTERIYAHFEEDQFKDSAKKLSNALKPKSKIQDEM